jgi:hypothetical protein
MNRRPLPPSADARARRAELPSQTALPLGHHLFLRAGAPGPSCLPQSFDLLSRLAGPSQDLFPVAQRTQLSPRLAVQQAESICPVDMGLSAGPAPLLGPCYQPGPQRI